MNYFRGFRFMFICIGLLLVLLTSQSSDASPNLMGWHWETIAPGSYVALVIDENDQGHVAFYDNAAHDLKYAVRSPTGWQVSTADNGYYVGLYPSLDLDKNGYPHISHVSGSIHRLYYTYKDATGWYSETVVDGIPFEKVPLAIDVQDQIHLAYQVDNPSTSQITHAVRVDGIWQTETVYNCPHGPYQGCSSIDMTLDLTGNPHIVFAYRDSTGGRLIYATKNDDDWLIEQAGETGGGNELSLALDGNSQPHISYITAQFLGYTFRDTTGWHTEVVVGEHRGLWNNLAVSTGGTPHLAYYDMVSMTLHYAYREETGWHDLVLDSSGWVGHFPDIALIHGYPAIAYDDPSETGPQVLRYAYLTPLDIQPGEFPNLIDPTSNNKVMVVVIGTAELDVKTIDPLTAAFGPAGASINNGRFFYKDADLDGDLDLLLAFRLGEAGIPCGATTAVLHAQTYTGESFTGWDDITTIGCDD